MSSRRINYEENKYPSQPSSVEQQTPIVLYLNEKLKILETENNELKKEMSSKSSNNIMILDDKEKIEYYLRLRKEMIEQIENLKSENMGKDIKFKNEVAKLNGTLFFIKKQSLNLTRSLMKRRRTRMIIITKHRL
jgi:hypothetical protein